MGRTSIIVVAFNHRGYLPDCVRAVERACAGRADVRLILVDNASTDGSAAVLRALLAPDGTRTQAGIPALLIENDCNLGFAGGNNAAIRRAIADGDEFVYLLNPDTEVEPGFLDAALAAAAADERIAEVQSLLLRHPDRAVVNTWGNAQHFLGFGYAAGDGTPLAQAGAHVEGPHEIAYASGAGVLVRLSALAAIGAFAEELFAYHEDLELSWRARLAGLRVVVAPASRVAHKYEFSRSTRKYYFMERNRVLVLLWCYRPSTLLLLAPALAAMEAGLVLFAVRGGWAREKLAAYAHFARPRGWRQVLAGRRRVQAVRRAGDREATALFTGEVVFPAVSPWLLTAVANPLLSLYWRGVRRLIH